MTLQRVVIVHVSLLDSALWINISVIDIRVFEAEEQGLKGFLKQVLNERIEI